MTTHNPPTAEDVELAASVIKRHAWRECQCEDGSPESLAEEVLAALAGRLIPAGDSLAAAESRGWQRAVEALRAQAKAERREAATYPSGSPGRSTCLHYAVGIERAVRALTEEAEQ